MSGRVVHQPRSPSLPPPVSLRLHSTVSDEPGVVRSPSLPPPVSIPHLSFSNVPDPPHFSDGGARAQDNTREKSDLSTLKIEDLNDGSKTTPFEHAMAALDAARQSRDNFFQTHVLDHRPGSAAPVVGGRESFVPPDAKEIMNQLATELVSTANLLDDSRKELTREKAYSESLKIELTNLEEQLDGDVMGNTTGVANSFVQEINMSDEADNTFQRSQAQRVSPEPNHQHHKATTAADASTQVASIELHGREQRDQQCQSHDVYAAVSKIQLAFRNRHMRDNVRILRERERRWEDERRAKAQHFLRAIVEEKRKSQGMVEQAAQALEKSRSEILQSTFTTEANLVEAFNLGHEPVQEEEEPVQTSCFSGFSRKEKRDGSVEKLRAQRARYEENVAAFRRIVSRLQDEARQQQSKTESLVPQILDLRQLVLKAWQAGEKAFALLEQVGMGRDGREQQQVVELQRAVTALEFRAAEHKDIAEQIQVQWATDTQMLQTDMKRLSADGLWARQRAEKAEEALEAARTQISFLEAKKGAEGEVLALKQERQELRATSAALNATLSLYQEEVKRLSATILESQLTGSPATLRASSRTWGGPPEAFGDSLLVSRQVGGGSKGVANVSDGRMTMSEAVMGSWKPLRLPPTKMASKAKPGRLELDGQRNGEEGMSSRVQQQLEGPMESLQELSRNARFRHASSSRGFGTSNADTRTHRSHDAQRETRFSDKFSGSTDRSLLTLSTNNMTESRRHASDVSPSPSPERTPAPSISVTLTIVHAQNLPGGEAALADPYFCAEMDGAKMKVSILQSPGGFKTEGIEPRKYCARAKPSSTIRWRDGTCEEEFWHKDWYTLHDRDGAPLVGASGEIAALQILVMVEVNVRRENESLERKRRIVDSRMEHAQLGRARPYALAQPDSEFAASVSPSPPASPEQREPCSAEQI